MKILAVAGAATLLLLGACDAISTTTPETPSGAVSVPSPVTSAARAQALRAVCDAERKVLRIIDSATGTALASTGDLVTRIARVEAALDTTAEQFRSNGQPLVAERVSELADAVGAFRQAVQERSAGAIITAAAKITQAVRGVPACRPLP